ncbi:MAG: class I SAM-dependent methyltransferase [Chloroflexi bacterium]|nr:class I SAM-dependent methyltransferase [Chloroflexota bacterium]
MESDPRTPEQIREHYGIEKELANRLRNSTREERKTLYKDMYNELFRRIPHHPQLTRKASKEDTDKLIAYQSNDIVPLVNSKTVFLEVGPGDCAFSFVIAKAAKMVYAVDVSEEITQSTNVPNNFKLILSDGTNIPLPADSVNLAYSNQLMEHLHPDDAETQLKEIYNALAPGGIYFCCTPNRLIGPTDVSRHFDQFATGLHLKEYTIRELSRIFRKVGFRKLRVLARIKKINFIFPASLVIIMEGLIDILPYKQKKRVAYINPIFTMLGIKLIGTK